jgi:hypothetical protein
MLADCVGRGIRERINGGCLDPVRTVKLGDEVEGSVDRSGHTRMGESKYKWNVSKFEECRLLECYAMWLL